MVITNNKVKDWHIMEFFVPITETRTVGDDFLIRGIAINETTTRNGIKYIASELEKAAPSFRGKPILLDHENSVKNIVGRTTENVNFNSAKKGIEFEAKIMDENIKKMINDGRITDVSIGAKVEDLQHNKEENTMTAIGLEGLEISLVAVPGDPGANLASAMDNSFQIREALMNGEEPIDYLNDEKEVNKMAEEEKEQTETETETEEVEDEESVEDDSAEEKLKKVVAELAKYKKAEEKAKLKEELKKEIMSEIKKQKKEITPPAIKEIAEEEKPEPEDETKGVVGEPEEEEDTSESLVIEKADSGKGFQIYRDFSKENSGRFSRLVRE